LRGSDGAQGFFALLNLALKKQIFNAPEEWSEDGAAAVFYDAAARRTSPTMFGMAATFAFPLVRSGHRIVLLKS